MCLQSETARSAHLPQSAAPPSRPGAPTTRTFLVDVGSRSQHPDKTRTTLVDPPCPWSTPDRCLAHDGHAGVDGTIHPVSEPSPTEPRLAPVSARSDDTARIQSLAAMARALGLSVRLEQMVELAAEEALKALKGSSVSISSLRPGTGGLHTMINVGDLAP